ncbi:hypothetical protein RRG08_058322 [Elysia crispata]|uniref:Uncharacterized protein n=1 Tax=Elysia crispata TaxID=231223 RepID=A0AAE0YVU9_9GAST|nr:hypothetical protein RRG08_058322 [Elysia crispata]
MVGCLASFRVWPRFFIICRNSGSGTSLPSNKILSNPGGLHWRKTFREKEPGRQCKQQTPQWSDVRVGQHPGGLGPDGRRWTTE